MTDLKATQEALLQAQNAFTLGNYALVRSSALPLLETGDSATKKAAQKLLDQIAPAPIGKYLFLLTALLLLAVTYFAYTR